MPVLTTLVAIHLLGESEQNSLLDPGAMRRQARTSLAESPSLAPTLVLIDELEVLAREYTTAADEALAAYKSRTSEWDSSKEDLLAILDPIDRQRRDTLVAVVDAREALRNLLSDREWQALFN